MHYYSKKLFNYFHLFSSPLFIVLFLLSHNADEAVPFASAVVAYALLQVIWLLLFILIWLSDKKYLSSAVFTTLTLFLFFSFDTLTYLSDNLLLTTFTWAGLQLIIIFLFSNRKLESCSLSKLISLVSIILCITNIYCYATSLSRLPDDEKRSNNNFTVKHAENNRPIYHIYLDGLARTDVLKRIYHVDITRLTKELQNIGFYIAPKSLTNYCQTVLSMSSTLNMDYLQHFLQEKPTYAKASSLIGNSVVFNKLKKYNYKIVTLDNGYPVIDLKSNADVYYETKTINMFDKDICTYTYLILAKSVLGYINLNNSVLEFMDFSKMHREQVLNTFSLLKELPKHHSKSFFFIHTVFPHPPFVLSKNGEPIHDQMALNTIADGSDYTRMKPKRIDNYKTMYAKQAQYAITRIIMEIRTIIKNSPTKPIIILQSDHGPGSELDNESLERTNLNERMPIFNAYYFPDVDTSMLYPTITPVNSYRVLFNLYFNEKNPLLEDKSYYSTWSHPFKFYKLETCNGEVRE